MNIYNYLSEEIYAVSILYYVCLESSEDPYIYHDNKDKFFMLF